VTLQGSVLCLTFYFAQEVSCKYFYTFAYILSLPILTAVSFYGRELAKRIYIFKDAILVLILNKQA
jgi:hypothetical protein